MAIRLIDLIGISVFLIAITSVVAAGYTLFGNALEAIGFVVSGFVGTVFGVISVPFVAIKSVVAVQWALFDAIRFVANIVLDVVCVPLIAIKSNVVAAENALFDAIHSFEMGVYFEVVQVWLVRLLISLFCMAFVAYIARLVWTNRWGLTGFVRNGVYASFRKIKTDSKQTHYNSAITASAVPSLNSSRTERRDPDERHAKACVICQDNVRNMVCIPCRHFALCEDCAHRLSTGNFAHGKSCPMCRVPIRELMKVYI